MSARKLFEVGFTDLVSIVPPGASLTPNSKIKESMLGKVPGKKGKQGWYGYAFTDPENAATAQAVTSWDRWGSNVGMLGDNFPAVDIDVDDEQLAEVVAKYAIDLLGNAPVRLSTGTRKLLVYRTENPFPRIAMDITLRGEVHKVEILGQGRQYLVHGKHPSGADYRWAPVPLWDMIPDDLVRISKQDVLEFLGNLKKDLEAKGVECSDIAEVGGKLREAAAAVPQANLMAPSSEDLSDLMAKLPNGDDVDRDLYIRIMHAVKAAAGDEEVEGLAAFLEWAERWEGGTNDPELVEDEWNGLKGPFRLGWNWLLEFARGQEVNVGDQMFADATPPQNPPPAGMASAPAPSVPRDQVDLSDEWLISRILPTVRDRLRHVVGISWYVWKGHVWEKDGALKHERIVRAAMKHVALRLADIARQQPTKEDARPYRSAAKRFQSASGLNSVIRLLESELSLAPDGFDSDLMTLNTPEGVIDLETGRIREAKPKDLLSRSTAVGLAAGPHPKWSAFLEHLTEGDKELELFLQRYAGYALTGRMHEKVFIYGFGSHSDTGKSTFIKVLSGIMKTGTGGYADTVDVKTLVEKGAGYNLARLPGVRLVSATEPRRGQTWNESLIKAVTGGDEIEARGIYEAPITFRPQFKLLVAGNAPPSLAEVDDAMLRRVLIVPMNNRVPREEQIGDYENVLIEEEGPQILAWALRGALDWKQNGLQIPDAVQLSTQQYGEDEDTLKQWIEEECQLGIEYEAPRTKLYRSWASWCRAGNFEPGTSKAFKQMLDSRAGELNLEDTRVGDKRYGKRGYTGIRLRPIGQDQFDDVDASDD